jgi:L-cysteine desulfidase
MEKYEELFSILRKETKPALGCTGPIATCYCAAQAYDAIGGEIKRIVVKGSGGMVAKNDDVAFPGTEMLGAEMSVALGAICGDPNAGLEVLHNVTPEGELKARKVAELVEFDLSWDHKELAVPREVRIETDRGVGIARTYGGADGLVYKERNGEVLVDVPPDSMAKGGTSPILKYKIKDFYDFATNYPIEKFDFMLEAAKMNTDMAEYNFGNEDVGIGIGRSLHKAANPSRTSRAKALAAAGCEGRMSGVNKPIMSCANKGNVGIASSLPLVSLAKDIGSSDEQLQRAMAMSFLMSIAVIHRIGKAPTMCSCMVAAILGVAAGTVILLGGTEKQVEIAIQNVIPNVFGVVCDGAKLACALRISTATGIAVECAELAVSGVRLANNQGVLAATADESIDFLGKTALYGMVESDNALSRQMYDKRKVWPLETLTERQKR